MMANEPTAALHSKTEDFLIAGDPDPAHPASGVRAATPQRVDAYTVRQD